MFCRFGFESEIYADLGRMPLHVRMKLDLTGVKISLKTWLAFSLEERWALCHLPIETEEERKAFASYLDFLSRRYAGQAAERVPPVGEPPWEDLSRIPDPVQARTKGSGRGVTPQEWRGLDSCRRYALYKLALSKNEPEQFDRALSEFREGSGKKT